MEEIICFCFGYSAADIEQDMAQNGAEAGALSGGSAIMERIIAQRAAGRCQCVSKNPKGR